MAAGGKEDDDDDDDPTTGGTVSSAWGFGPATPRPAADAQNDEEVDNDEGIRADAAALGILLAGDTVTAKSTGLFWWWSVCRRFAYLRFFKRANPP